MKPETRAIQEPHQWTLVDTSLGSFEVRHPNGVVLSISWLPTCWRIQKMVGDQPRYLAQVPKASTAPGFDGCVADTQRVTGADARAQLDRVLLDIRAWAVVQPDHLDRVLLLREPRTIGLQHQVHTRLPRALGERLRALQAVLTINPATGDIERSPMIWLDLPTTGHGVLQLLKDARTP